MPRLVLLSEGLTGKTYELNVEKSTVGRVSDNTIEIADGSVSSHHCEIILKGPEVHVHDLGSTNGTFVDGEKVSQSVVKPGQILRLGMISMRLETGDAVKKPKVMDHTMVIPQGVKLDDLQGGGQVGVQGEGFSRKSSKATKVFIGMAVVVGICLVVLLLFIVTNS